MIVLDVPNEQRVPLRVEDVVDRPDQTGEGLIVSPRLAGDLAGPVEDLGGGEALFEVDLISVVVEVEGEHVGVEAPPSPAPAGLFEVLAVFAGEDVGQADDPERGHGRPPI